MIDPKKVEEKFAEWLENLSDDDIKFAAVNPGYIAKLAWIDAWWEAIEDISAWRNVVEEKPRVGERVIGRHYNAGMLIVYMNNDGRWYKLDGEEVHITHWKHIPNVMRLSLQLEY